jgi:hypothetical protein
MTSYDVVFPDDLYLEIMRMQHAYMDAHTPYTSRCKQTHVHATTTIFVSLVCNPARPQPPRGLGPGPMQGVCDCMYTSASTFLSLYLFLYIYMLRCQGQTAPTSPPWVWVPPPWCGVVCFAPPHVGWWSGGFNLNNKQFPKVPQDNCASCCSIFLV